MPVRPLRGSGSLSLLSLTPPWIFLWREAYELRPRQPSRGWRYLLRHPITQMPFSWCRNILPCCPSPTPCGLGLGPTNPGRITLPQETLGLRCPGFSPGLLLLMPTCSLPLRPGVLTVSLQPRVERSPTRCGSRLLSGLPGLHRDRSHPTTTNPQLR